MTAQEQRRAENAKLLENANVRAALEMLSKSEGTNGNYHLMVYGTVISSPRFPALVGKRNVKIPSLDRFPEIMVKVNSKGLKSSAAGKYQILSKTYKGLSAKLGLSDFSPRTQDLMAVELIRQRGAIPYLVKGDIQGALTKTTLNKEWASLAGAGYGQREHSIKDLVTWFNAALGKASNFVADNNNTIAGGSSVLVIAAAAVAFFF